MDEPVRITTPLTDEVVEKLHAGDRVLVSGVVYTARDAAHRRLVDLLEAGKPLPLEVKGQIIYYVGPSPAPPGRPVGAAGPTTAYRMDAFAPTLMALGLKGMIGKGARNQAVKDAIRKHKAVYLAAIGGVGALMSRSITAAEIVAYEDLGTEAIRRLEVKDLPLIVANDCHGGDLYEEGKKAYARTA